MTFNAVESGPPCAVLMLKFLTRLAFNNHCRTFHLIPTVNYVKQLAQDYATATRDTGNFILENPVRSLAWGCAITAGSITYAFCPTEADYHTTLVESGLDMWEVPPLLRNPRSANHITERFDLWSRGRLRVSQLGLLSVVWRDDRSPECMLYSEACPYSLPANGGGQFTSLVRLLLFDRPNEVGWTRLFYILSDRVLDIGFMGRWWFMHYDMQDYDINPSEWSQSSVSTDNTEPEKLL